MCNFSSPRYDGVWSDWRTTTYGESVSEEETLDLATDEDITSISGYSEDYDGDTLSLQAETSAARQWGPLGNHGGDRGYTSLRSSPPSTSGLRLHHLSGDQTKFNFILRFSST